MKKIVLVVICFALVIVMVACSEKNTESDNTISLPNATATTLAQEQMMQKIEEQAILEQMMLEMTQEQNKPEHITQEQIMQEMIRGETQEQITPGQENSNDSTDIIEIKEKMFIAQITNIYLNLDDYIGRKVQLEGFYYEYYDEKTDTTYQNIIRNSPGCCGDDGIVGFEFFWDGECPKADDWLKITGIIEIVKENGDEYLRIKANTLEVLEERGLEFVNN